MTIVFILLTSLVVMFGFVVLFGAPFLPTLGNRTQDAFELLDLKPGQTLLELGSGDGRILNLAAQKGIYAIGYELNPLLVLYSKIATFRYKRFVKIYWRNYWKVTLPVADGIYVFLLAKYMEKLNKKIIQEISKPVKLVSFGFAIPNIQTVREKSGMYLYCILPKSRLP